MHAHIICVKNSQWFLNALRIKNKILDTDIRVMDGPTSIPVSRRTPTSILQVFHTGLKLCFFFFLNLPSLIPTIGPLPMVCLLASLFFPLRFLHHILL